jgi:hypothetical protein
MPSLILFLFMTLCAIAAVSSLAANSEKTKIFVRNPIIDSFSSENGYFYVEYYNSSNCDLSGSLTRIEGSPNGVCIPLIDPISLAPNGSMAQICANEGKTCIRVLPVPDRLVTIARMYLYYLECDIREFTKSEDFHQFRLFN